jgi:hypothetical protein
MLFPPSPIRCGPETLPQLIVVVDTEEEFDWSAEPDRESNTTHAIEALYRVQDIFNEYAIKPCYVVDYPIATSKQSVSILKGYFDANQCEIGAHLHPWVNPPFEEALSKHNMFPGNLDKSLEYSKLQSLTNAISESFQITPSVYKAGRYGVGPNTAGIMRKLGYDIDLSICTAFDYRADGGPDFSHFESDPYWFGKDSNMLEIPLTGAFVGIGGPLSSQLYNIAGHFNFLKARGILSRLGIVDRLMLSPEGYSTDEHIKLTEFLYKSGVRTFTWNFHSPSVVPGMTMYTSNENQVQQFLDSFRRYFDYFFGKLGGVASTPHKIKEHLESQQ